MSSVARLARGAVLALVLQVIGAGLAYLSIIAFARWMGTSQFGVYAYAMAWATILALLAGLGFPLSVLRFVSQYRAEGDDARLRGILRMSRGTALAAGLVVATLGTIVVVAFFPDGSRGGAVAAILAMWLIPAGALINVNSAIIRAGGRVVGAYAPPLVIRPLAILLGSTAVWLAWGRLTAVTALLVTFGVLIAIALLQSIFVREVSGRGMSLRSAAYAPRTWLRVSAPLLLVGGFQIALGQTDLLIVGAMRGVRDAALYFAATKTATLASYVLGAVDAVAAPQFSELEAKRDRTGLQRLAMVSVEWVFWPTLLITTGLALLASEILGLFGSDFAGARPALLILLFAQVINAAFGSVGYLLSMTGHQDDTARVYGITSALNVALCYAGVRAFGLTGAACATALSMIVWNVWLYRVTIRRTGVRVSIFSSLMMRRARQP